MASREYLTHTSKIKYVTFHEHRIVRVTMLPGAAQTLENAKETYACLVKLVEPGKAPDTHLSPSERAVNSLV